MGDTIQIILTILEFYLLFEFLLSLSSGMFHIESYLVSRKIRSELIKYDPIFKNVYVDWIIGKKRGNSYKFWITQYSENPFEENIGEVFLVGDKIILKYWNGLERIETEFKIKEGKQWQS